MKNNTFLGVLINIDFISLNKMLLQNSIFKLIERMVIMQKIQKILSVIPHEIALVRLCVTSSEFAAA